MREPVGKAMATDEHGRVLDETDIMLESPPDLRADGGTIRLRFARPLAVFGDDVATMKIDLFENAVQRDLRASPLQAKAEKPSKADKAAAE